MPTSAYLRILTLAFVEWLTGQAKTPLAMSFSASILYEVTCRLSSIRTEISKLPALPNTSTHRHQIRLWQVLCCLSSHLEAFRQIIKQSNVPGHVPTTDALWSLFGAISLSEIRHLMEIFFTRLSISSPASSVPFLIQGLTDFNAPTQQTSSFIIVTGALLMLATDHCTTTPDSPFLPNDEVQQLVSALLPFASSNSGHVRGTVHSVLLDVLAP